MSGTGVSKVSIMQSHGLRPHTNTRIRVHPFRTTQPLSPNRLEAGLSNRHDVNYRLTTATAKPPCHPLDAYATFQISLCLYTILEYTLSFLIFFLSLLFFPLLLSTVNFLDSEIEGTEITAGDVQVDLYRVIRVLRVCLIPRTCGNIVRVGDNWVWLLFV